MEYCFSELVVDTEADDVVGARVSLCAVGGLLLVVAIEADEVAGIEAHFLVDVPGTAKSNRVAVTGEGGILLVAVSQAVVCALCATADGDVSYGNESRQ